MTPDQRAICLMGPTASGKSALAMALVDQLERIGIGSEIVSVDSAQVYRGMDIGTAKPGAAERQRVVHHLIDICDPEQAYSAARFASDASELIADIRERGRLPLLVGGTMLYFRALRYGLNALPSADATIREQIVAKAEVEGWPAMHEALRKLDPATAARLHPNDSQRVQRALEVHAVSGQPLSYWIGRKAKDRSQDFLCFALMPEDRALLHASIERRLDAMFDSGLVDEVARLRQRPGLTGQMPSMRSVGYRQVWAHLDGVLSLAEARQRALEASRQLAKRQITWLRSEHDVCELKPQFHSGQDHGNASILRKLVGPICSRVDQWLQESA